MNLAGVFFRAALVDNLALTLFLGMCTLLGASRALSTAVGMGAAVSAVMVVTAPLNWLIEKSLLAPGALAWAGRPDLDLSYLRLIVFMGVIAAAVQILELVLDRFFPALAARFGIFLPLVAVNCAILAASLFLADRVRGLAEGVVFAAGSGAGWWLAILLLAAIRGRMGADQLPEGRIGLGQAFVVTGILSMAFAAFGGVIPT